MLHILSIIMHKFIVILFFSVFILTGTKNNIAIASNREKNYRKQLKTMKIQKTHKKQIRSSIYNMNLTVGLNLQASIQYIIQFSQQICPCTSLPMLYTLIDSRKGVRYIQLIIKIMETLLIYKQSCISMMQNRLWLEIQLGFTQKS